MNKYQEALNILSTYSDENGVINTGPLSTLQELVNRAKPKKPIKLYDKRRSKCPNCESQLPFKKNAINKHMPRLYCDRCGQRIDWSEDDGQ